jgi:16S rRNA (guanine(966)-N(2))-methyltransferase RsmD
MRVISGEARGVRLLTPDGRETRPTTDRVKEGMFNALQFDIEGRTVLDLFAGSGQLAIEALSRGAKQAVLVDASQNAIKLLRENVKRARVEDRAEIVRSDYVSYLQSCRRKFDIVFLDPPYAEKFLENSLRMISEIDILSDGGIIVCERPTEKQLVCDFDGLMHSKDYRYGKTLVTIFRQN